MTIPELAEAERPLPVVTLDTAPFWDALKEHKLKLQRCTDCKTYSYPPLPMCSNCNSFNNEWVESKGLGKIYSWIIVNRPFHPYFVDVPHNIVLVELEEGPRLFSNLLDVAPEDIHDGMPVKVDFIDVDDGFSLHQFRPVNG